MTELRDEVELQLRLAGSLTPSFATHIFTGLDADSLDSGAATAGTRYPTTRPSSSTSAASSTATAPTSAVRSSRVSRARSSQHAYDVMLAAAEAGRAACRPGALAREVNAACRGPIEDAGLGEHFRHRMGHGIGLDVHERPFLSPEDETPLEAGMTFTDEPSIIVPGAFGLRIENVVVCAEGGARVLNDYPDALVANG